MKYGNRHKEWRGIYFLFRVSILGAVSSSNVEEIAMIDSTSRLVFYDCS